MKAVRFGTDGIRGEAGIWPINTLGAMQIGQGLGTFLSTETENPKVLIGRDTRISGDALCTAIGAGLLAAGADVVDVGVITTAGVAYLAKRHAFCAGVVVSASHNKWQENGIKIIGGDGFKLADEKERAIEGMIAEVIQENGEQGERQFGHLERRPELVDDYINHLIKPFVELDFSSLKIALDCSNGAASAIAPHCFELLGCRPYVLHAQPNGTNINADCGSEAVRDGNSDLAQILQTDELHFGAAFDGDADRVVFLDSESKLVDGDHILYILGKHLQENEELAGNTVVTTHMANGGLEASLDKLGIKTIRTPVGDKYILREIVDKGYLLGGEQSGHIILFDDLHTTGDGIYTALYLASVLLEKGTTLSELAAPMKKFPQVIASAKVSSKPALSSLKTLEQEKRRAVKELGESGTINIRYSGTEALVRVMVEAGNNHTTSELAGIAKRLFEQVQAETGDLGSWYEIKDVTTGQLADAA